MIVRAALLCWLVGSWSPEKSIMVVQREMRRCSRVGAYSA